MKVMVVGGGGREHAIIKKLRESDRIDRLYALPGNGGIAADAECVDIGAKDIDGICRFAEENGIDFAVVAPDDPLVLGAVDRLEALGVKCFGPHACAAEIEGSKVFAKNLMRKYNIPTAEYEVFERAEDALEYIKTCNIPIVVKANGLALGKGVIIAETREEAASAIHEIMEEKIFGASGSSVVIEEFLTGPEVSVLAFTDGTSLVPMVSSMDHKRALDGDEGLNTGGMGTIAPNPYYTADIAEVCMREIFLPTVNAMKNEGREFRGCLYFGLMLTPAGPKVIEYNCRFGDPETQVVLPLLKSDLFEIMEAVADGRLGEAKVEFSDGYACCVVLASDGYPKKYDTGFEIALPKCDSSSDIFVAGAKLDSEGVLRTSGGRVLGVTATASTLLDAVNKAYSVAEHVHFDNKYCRSDIGKRALACKR